MNCLFPVIRVAFNIDTLAVIPTAEEFEELSAFARKQSILLVIYTGVGV